MNWRVNAVLGCDSLLGGCFKREMHENWRIDALGMFVIMSRDV